MIESFIKDYEYLKNVSLKKYNTYKIDVMCNYLIYPDTIEKLIQLLKFLRTNSIKYLILGGGSKVKFGGGEMTAAIKILINGRFTDRYEEEKLFDSPFYHEFMECELTREIFSEYFSKEKLLSIPHEKYEEIEEKEEVKKLFKV